MTFQRRLEHLGRIATLAAALATAFAFPAAAQEPVAPDRLPAHRYVQGDSWAMVCEGGRTENGGYHPGFDANEDDPEILVGLHLGKGGYAAHVTYYRFLGSRDTQGPGSSTDWINLSFERRF